MKSYQQIALALASALGFVVLISYPKQVHARFTKDVNIIIKRFVLPLPSSDVGTARDTQGTGSHVLPGIYFNLPSPPPDVGTASDTQGAAHRGASGLCPEVNTPLTALVPSYQNEAGNTVTWGLTVAEHPTFLVYVPYTLTPELPITFRLDVEGKDEQGNPVDQPVYETTFNLAGTPPGIVSFQLPSTVTLEVGKTYYWYVAVRCNPDPSDPSDHSGTKFVKAAIQRNGAIASPSELETATPQEQVALYAAHGIWYDGLATLAQLRRAEPNNASLQATWSALLQAVDLNTMTQAPVIDCCIAQDK